MPDLMKGFTWAKMKHKVVYPCFVEPKVDEIRCRVTVFGVSSGCSSDHASVKFESYSGKTLANLERFGSMFIQLAKRTGSTEFDCGFECNGNFNDSYRWVRSTKAAPEDLLASPKKFYLFDLPLFGGQYHERRIRVRQISNYAESAGLPLLALPSKTAADAEEVLALYSMYREHGYEGAMVKARGGLYVRTRSADWLKLKPEEDASGIIEGINMAYCGVAQPELGLRAGDPLGRAGSVRVRMLDGSIAEPHGITHDTGRDMIENPQLYIGETCDFKYMERDRQGGYRHPTFHRVREAV